MVLTAEEHGPRGNGSRQIRNQRQKREREGIDVIVCLKNGYDHIGHCVHSKEYCLNTIGLLEFSTLSIKDNSLSNSVPRLGGRRISVLGVNTVTLCDCHI